MAKFDCERIKSTNRFYCEAAPTIQAIGDGLTHFGEEFEKEFCNIFTLGDYKRGKATCGIEIGVGHDENGFYTYSPSLPDTKYRTPGARGPSADELSRLATTMNRAAPYRYEYDFSDAFGVGRFLPPNYVLGDAWPESEGALATPTREGLIRRKDREGGGHFLALRADKRKGTLGFHGGEDYVAMPNEKIYAPISGEITRMNIPGKRGLTGLDIRSASGYTATVYYVAVEKSIQEALRERASGRAVSTPEVLKVSAGRSVVGYAQDLSLPYRYGPYMTNHVHVTLRDRSGHYIAPSDPRITIRPSPAGELRTKKPN